MSAAVVLLSRLERDVRGGDLAGLVVGHPDHGGIGDLGMGEQQRLELGGWDLEALVLDELLEPVDDVEVAVGVDVADVAGVQPTVIVDRGLRGGVVVQVALHHLWASNPHLAVLVDTERRPGDRIDDVDLGVGDRDADRARFEHPSGVAWLTGDSSVMP